MTILRIEHAVSDFDAWYRAFVRGWTLCAARSRGLRGYRVFQPVEEPDHIKVDLEFDSRPQAESIRAALTNLWKAGVAVPALTGAARAQIVETMDSERL